MNTLTIFEMWFYKYAEQEELRLGTLPSSDIPEKHSHSVT